MLGRFQVFFAGYQLVFSSVPRVSGDVRSGFGQFYGSGSSA